MKDTQPTLLARLRDGGDGLAWQEFLSAYWRPMYVFALRRGCSEHVAEDAVQEALLEVFRNRESFHYNPAKGRFRNWLFTIVSQKIVAAHRKNKRHDDAAPIGADDALADPGDAGPLEQFEEVFERGLVAAMLEVVRQEVKPATYQAFELTVFGGLSGNEAAAMTGLTRNAVFMSRKRVLDRLRELGAAYDQDGALDAEVKKLVEFFPTASVERKLTRTVRESLAAPERPR